MLTSHRMLGVSLSPSSTLTGGWGAPSSCAWADTRASKRAMIASKGSSPVRVVALLDRPAAREGKCRRNARTYCSMAQSPILMRSVVKSIDHTLLIPLLALPSIVQPDPS